MISPDKNNIVGYFTITIKPITVNTDEFSNTVRRKIARVSEQNSDNGKYSLSAYLIAQLGKNYDDSIGNTISGDNLLSIALGKVKELQYMAGGMVVFLESENKDRLLDFYEKQNGFKRFDTKVTKKYKENSHTLVRYGMERRATAYPKTFRNISGCGISLRLCRRRLRFQYGKRNSPQWRNRHDDTRRWKQRSL